jgi:hypothetical protein
MFGAKFSSLSWAVFFVESKIAWNLEARLSLELKSWPGFGSVSFVHVRGIHHGQTLANRTKPGPSFQL